MRVVGRGAGRYRPRNGDKFDSWHGDVVLRRPPFPPGLLRQCAFLDEQLGRILDALGRRGRRGTDEGVVDAWNVPKSELMVQLQMAIAREEIGFAKSVPLRQEFVEELLKIGPDQKAKGSGHDDLVMAVALGCWVLRPWSGSMRGVWGRSGWPDPILILS